MHKHNPTLSVNKHVIQICHSSPSAAAGGVADGSGECQTPPVNGIGRSLSRAEVPKTKSLPVSAITFPTAFSLYIAQRCLRKNIRYPRCSQRENCCLSKGNQYQLCLFFLLEACQRNSAGWSSAGWPANAKLPLPHHHSSITRPCCSIERSSAKLLVFTCTSSTRQAMNASTRLGSTRLWGNHMHDHSRFQIWDPACACILRKTRGFHCRPWRQGSAPRKYTAHDTYSSIFLVHKLRQSELTKEGRSKWRLWPFRPSVSCTGDGTDWPKVAAVGSQQPISDFLAVSKCATRYQQTENISG